MPLTQLLLYTSGLVGALAIVSTACGGRTHLVPGYQIGRLSCDVIVANDASVRVVVRTAAWPHPQFDFGELRPIEITFDNASSHPLSVSQRRITFVTDSGQRIFPIPPSDLQKISHSEFDDDVRLPIEQMKNRALAEGVLPRNGRRTGFVYFESPDDAEQLDLEIDLFSAESGRQFGTITVPFFID